MKVGVDARLLSRPLTGIGRYTLEMCRSLSKQERITLYLYSPSPILDDAKKNLPPARFRTMNWQNGVLRQLWAESCLPLWAKMDDVDVFWGPAHRLPRLLPRAIPAVVTIHDLVWKYASETMRSATYFLEKIQMPSAVRVADAVVVDSQSTADAVSLEFSVDADSLAVIPLAASHISNIVSFDALHEFGVDHPFFLFVGTLEPRKNLAGLLAAYAVLPETVRSGMMLVIVGGKGWGGVNLQETIARLGLGDHVKVLGYVDEPTLAMLYAHAKFLAMPSLYEGFGLPLVEATAHGTPVLTANNSSMPEVAGDAGLLVDALDVDSIACGLNQLITDDQLLAGLAANAKLNAARFSWDESAGALVSVFKRAVANRNSR